MLKYNRFAKTAPIINKSGFILDPVLDAYGRIVIENGVEQYSETKIKLYPHEMGYCPYDNTVYMMFNDELIMVAGESGYSRIALLDNNANSIDNSTILGKGNMFISNIKIITNINDTSASNPIYRFKMNYCYNKNPNNILDDSIIIDTFLPRETYDNDNFVANDVTTYKTDPNYSDTPRLISEYTLSFDILKNITLQKQPSTVGVYYTLETYDESKDIDKRYESVNLPSKLTDNKFFYCLITYNVYQNDTSKKDEK